MFGLTVKSKIIQLLKIKKKFLLRCLSKIKFVEKALVTKEHQLCSELPGSWREKHFRKKCLDEEYIKGRRGEYIKGRRGEMG